MSVDILKTARSRIALRRPFWASLMLRTPMEVTDEFPTAATDMRSIFINPNFLEAITPGQVMTTIAHELGHIMLKHGLRMGARDPDLWNEAGDHAINLMLKEDGFEPLTNIQYEYFRNWCCDQKYAGMSAEQIYELLKKEDEGGSSSGKRGRGGRPRDTLGRDLLPPKVATPEEAKELEQQITAAVANAATAGRLAGNLPGCIERMIQSSLYPAVPWQELLARYMLIRDPSRTTWTKRNRRFPNIYLPGRTGRRMGDVVYIGDTSGSISNKDLERVAIETAAIADNLHPQSIRLVWADTIIQREQKFERNEIVKPMPKGGGGTDMRVPLHHVAQYEPVVVVLHTDGYTPWPASPPPYPLIVVCTTGAPVPFGEVVRFTP